MYRLRATILTNRTPEDDVVEVLTLANLCQKFKTLPNSGGVLDQDAYLMFMLQSVVAWQAERQELEMRRSRSGT